ncbi:MAG: hypothetical protein ACOC44_13365 [Promethearchaeia archaeon]
MRNLTNRERILNTFKHKEVDRLVFSPRIYYWFGSNNQIYRPKMYRTERKRRIPPQYRTFNQLKIYDYLDASPRYTLETIYLPLVWGRLQITKGFYIAFKHGPHQGETTIYYKTPVGTLRKVTRGGHIIEYPLKTMNDIEIMKYILNHTTYHFLWPFYVIANKIFGKRGIPSTYILRSPYMRLVVDYMGFSRTVINLRRHQEEMEEFMRFLDRWEDKKFEILARSPLKIINFGENIDANLSPPPYFKKYLMPYYERRVNQLHRAGKYCHIHMDGSLRDLLPLLDQLPFDGLEALTPKPQGDVTLEEIHDAIGQKIYLDGIPSVLFLPQYSLQSVKKFVNRLLDFFYPNIIVGVSDEMPPNGDMRKLEIIAKMVKEYNPY